MSASPSAGTSAWSWHLVGSLVLVAAGFVQVADGDPYGWVCIAFFGACALVPFVLARVETPGTYMVTVDDTGPSLERRGRVESIRWDDVERVLLATTSDGPWQPDQWLLFDRGEGEPLAVPTVAEGFDVLFDELSTRFPGFDFEPFIVCGTDDEVFPCWSRADREP